MKIGPLDDPFIYSDGSEYLFLLTALARDVRRLQFSVRDIIDYEMEMISKDAVKVKKANPPEGAINTPIAHIPYVYDDIEIKPIL